MITKVFDIYDVYSSGDYAEHICACDDCLECSCDDSGGACSCDEPGIDVECSCDD